MKNLSLIAAGLLVLSSCGIYDKYEKPQFSDLNVVDSISVPSWRQMFRDKALQNLIDTALVNNRDMNVAYLKLQEAKAQLTAAKLAYLPSASLSAEASAQSDLSITGKASWEIDIFGKLTNLRRQQQAAFQSSEAYCQAVRSDLVATVADTYYSLLVLDKKLQISEQTLKSWDRSISVLESLKAAGKSNDVAVLQAKAKRLALEASAMNIRKNISVAENSLCSIMGVSMRSIERGDMDSQTFSSLDNVPVAALSCRPDVRQSEMALAKSFYATNYARSAFYPSVSLTGTLGWKNDAGITISDPSTWLWSAIAGLTQPLFQRGSLVSSLKLAKAQQEEARHNFHQTLLDAAIEVNNAMVACQTASDRLAVHTRQTEALSSAVEKIGLMMIYSNTNYLEVLTAQQSLLDAELVLVEDRYDEIAGLIKLYEAAGGGRF